MLDLKVDRTPDDAAKILIDYVSDKCVDTYQAESIDGKKAIVLVFEKYYMRNSSRASLTVTIENMASDGQTRVHAAGSGGGQGMIFSFDWGASESFENEVAQALNKWKL